MVSGSAQAQKQQSGDKVSSPPGEKSHRLSSNGPQILPSLVESARAKVTPYSPHWRAFKDRLDKHLGQVIEGGYQASQLAWISDYALGYQCLKAADPTTASQYADKAIAVMKSAMRDYQRDSWTTLQFLAATNGRTSVYTLPNADLVPESLSIYVAPIKTVPLVRGKKPDTADPVAYYVEFIRVGDTPTTADYSKDIDWKRNGDLENNLLDWSPPGKEPAAGSTYYVSYADRNEAKHQKVTGYTLAETKVSFASAPSANQALFIEYVYGPPSSNGSMLAFQQTSAGDGGLNSIFMDATYPSRFLGKHLAMGLDWLDGYAGLTPALKAEATSLLVRWNDYVRDKGYMADSAASNYGAGSYCSRVMTALALRTRDRVNGTRILDEVLSWREKNLLPTLTNTTSSLKGGYWYEGWNYGSLAAENILLAGLALEAAGLVRADAERQWASEIIHYLIHSQPTPTTTYNGGDWYAYPAPFPGKTIFYLARSVGSDPAAKSYANQITQTYAGAPAYDYLELLFHDPAGKARDWSSEPLQYFAPGGGLLLARSDWNSNPVWLSVQFSNLLKAGHTTIPPGQIQIQRGADDLVVNAASVTETQNAEAKSSFGNSIVVDDNGDQKQTYRWAMGTWYGTPGVVVNDYQARADYVYISGDYKAAYSHNRAPGKGGPVTELNRQVVYLRPNWVVVYDRVTTVKESYPKQQRWHFLEAPTVSGNKFLVWRGRSKLFGAAYSSDPLSVSTSEVSVAKTPIQQMIVQNRNKSAQARYLTVLEVAPGIQSVMDAARFSTSKDGKWDEVQIANAKLAFAKTATKPGFQYSLSGPLRIGQSE